MYSLAWLGLLAPLSLFAVSIIPSPLAFAHSRTISMLGLCSGVCSLIIALTLIVALIHYGTFWTETLGYSGVGLSLYFDPLSVMMFALVSFIGVIVLLYSRNYLDGDPRQSVFIKRMTFTLASVLAIISAGNLGFLILAWFTTSVGLNALLLFYPERPAAQLAAKKKFMASRLSELLLMSAAVSLWTSYGTLALPELFTAVRTAVDTGHSDQLMLPSILIVIAALLKSAQLPFHGWLVEVMETPTPVSALLHAGVINAGGFLLLRYADVIAPSESALHFLSLVGGATALFGSVVMLTQTSVKVALAYSTIAQMGFMMLECGLGAFSAALLHIVAHSLYKAHAFLSSGSVIDLARASWTPSPGGQPHPARFAFVLAFAAPVAFAVGGMMHAGMIENPGAATLGTILLMSLAHLIANAFDETTSRYVLVKAIGMSAIVAASFFALHAGVEWIAAASLPKALELRDLEDLAIVLVVLVSFGAVTLFQSVMARHATSPFWQALYVHLSQGLYLNILANRAMLKVWPRRAAVSRF